MVQSIDIFRGLTASECDEVSVLMEMTSYNNGDLVISRNDNKRSVFFIIVGEVRVTSFTANGREASYNEKSAGQMFGEFSAIDGISRVADVVAITDVTLLVMSHVDFNQLLQSAPKVNEKVIGLLVQEVRSLTQRIYEYSAYGVRSRIHKRVYDLAIEASSGYNEVILTNFPRHLDIASRVATTREAVTREIRRLISLELLEKTDKGIRVPSIEKLKALLDDADD